MTTPALVVDTATGVSVTLPVAGPGARAHAFMIDWTIRFVLAAAWYVVAAVVYNGRLSVTAPLEAESGWFAGVLLPAASIYFLYHFVLEITMHGRTPGKRIAGVRIVSREGGTPAAGALITRNVFRLVDSFPALYSVGLVTTLLTRQHQRIGDLAAGTLLVYERAGPALPAAAAARRLDPATAELAVDLLARWEELTPAARGALARELLARRGASAPQEDAGLRAAIEALLREGAA